MGAIGTIFALATAPGRGAVAILRVSGPAAEAIGVALAGFLPPARMAVLRRLSDGREILDRALVLWFPGPNSYTGEDVLELHLHGGGAVTAAVANAVRRLGARLAEPGEFTRRAFDNGRLDLAEAEAIGDLVDAATDGQRRQALRQLEGGLSARIEVWRDALVHCMAWVEAVIDFPDEDLPAGVIEDAERAVRELARGMRRELDLSTGAGRLRDGVRVAIIGAPNVGKSSLLNRLARREAAIVSSIPGTTRDVIEVALDLGGVPVILADTAGLRETGDEIEAEGVARAHRWAEGADIVLRVMDAREPGPVEGRGDLVVWNKVDLVERPAGSGLGVSAVTGEGMEALVAALSEKAAGLVGGDGVLTRLRHREAVEAAVGALDRFGSAPDLGARAEELRLASRALGRVTGAVDVEDVLDALFRSFCIGK